MLTYGRIDLIVGSCADIQQPGSRVTCWSCRTTRRGPKEPAIIGTQTKRIAVPLGRQRSVPGTDSSGPSADDRHTDIVPVVYHDAAVGVDLAGRLPSEVINRRGITSGRYTVYVDVLAIRVDPNPVLHVAAGGTICHMDAVNRISGETVDVQACSGVTGKPRL